MKLVLVISSMTTGGAERVLSILANSWVRMGRQVTLVTTHDDGTPSFYSLDSEVKSRPILLSRIPGGGNLSNIKRTRALRGIIKDEAPDVVVSFLNFTNVLTLLACQGLNLPVVVSERLDPRVHRLNPTWNTLRRLLYPQAAILVNQTEAAANWFRGWMGEKIRVVANPVMEPQFNDGPPELVLERPSIVAMGRLHHQKGFDTLLHAMALVHTSIPELQLTILGEGALRGELESLRDQLGLHDVVNLPGKVKRPQDVLKQAEIFVLSSVTEGFPNVLCEAMAVGLPVISTSCPSGPDEIVTPGEDGVLVQVGDVKALADGVVEMMGNSAARVAMGEAACGVVGRFSLENILENWDEVFRGAGVPV